MKNPALVVVLLLVLMAGCSPTIVQVYTTDAVGIRHTDDVFTFDNDTVRIDYWFWAEGGKMGFRVYNKSNKPIYIDWKKSSYISNSYKLNYWSDKTESTTLSSSISRSFLYRDSIEFPKVMGYSSIGESISKSISTTSKPERITFIPPKSYIERYSTYKLMTDYYHFVAGDKDFTQERVPLNPNDNGTITVSSKKFSKETSPLDFRNFLTLSFKENFSEEFYVDNEFFIKEILTMKSGHFSYLITVKSTGQQTEMLPYKKGINFYKKVK